MEKKPGEPDQFDPYRGKGPGKLLALSAADGRKLAEIGLPGQPVFDGLAAADGKLLIALANGSVVCLDDAKK